MFRDQIWRPAIDLLEWAPRPRVHDLRHTHAATLIAANVSLTAIQQRLGHSSISVTSDVYGHLLPSIDDNMMAALNEGYRSPDEPTKKPGSQGRPGLLVAVQVTGHIWLVGYSRKGAAARIGDGG
jgi:hypothetical protein